MLYAGLGILQLQTAVDQYFIQQAGHQPTSPPATGYLSASQPVCCRQRHCVPVAVLQIVPVQQLGIQFICFLLFEELFPAIGRFQLDIFTQSIRLEVNPTLASLCSLALLRSFHRSLSHLPLERVSPECIPMSCSA